jgi:hypothetical protein
MAGLAGGHHLDMYLYPKLGEFSQLAIQSSFFSSSELFSSEVTSKKRRIYRINVETTAG